MQDWRAEQNQNFKTFSLSSSICCCTVCARKFQLSNGQRFTKSMVVFHYLITLFDLPSLPELSEWYCRLIHLTNQQEWGLSNCHVVPILLVLDQSRINMYGESIAAGDAVGTLQQTAHDGTSLRLPPLGSTAGRALHSKWRTSFSPLLKASRNVAEWNPWLHIVTQLPHQILRLSTHTKCPM